MENETSKNAFYKSRSLLGRLSASFKFMNENSVLFLKLGTFVLLPVAIVQGLYAAFYGNISPENVFSLGNLIALIVSFLVSVVGICVFNSLIYTLIHKYIEVGRLPAYQLKDLKHPLLANAKKVFIAGLITFVLFAVLITLIYLLATLTLYTLIVTTPLFFFLLVPFIYIECVYLLEHTTLMDAVKKSFSLGVRTWSSTFAILFLMSFLIGAIQLVASLPWFIGLMTGTLAQNAILEGGAGTLPGFYPYLMFILAGIAFLITLLSRGAVLITMAFQYASVETMRKERLLEEAQDK